MLKFEAVNRGHSKITFGSPVSYEAEPKPKEPPAEWGLKIDEFKPKFRFESELNGLGFPRKPSRKAEVRPVTGKPVGRLF